MSEPVEFLTKTRFKLSFNKVGNCTSFHHFSDELSGQWVWLVDATDGKNDPLFDLNHIAALEADIDRLSEALRYCRRFLDPIEHDVAFVDAALLELEKS